MSVGQHEVHALWQWHDCREVLDQIPITDVLGPLVTSQSSPDHTLQRLLLQLLLNGHLLVWLKYLLHACHLEPSMQLSWVSQVPHVHAMASGCQSRALAVHVTSIKGAGFAGVMMLSARSGLASWETMLPLKHSLFALDCTVPAVAPLQPAGQLVSGQAFAQPRRKSLCSARGWQSRSAVPGSVDSPLSACQRQQLTNSVVKKFKTSAQKTPGRLEESPL